MPKPAELAAKCISYKDLAGSNSAGFLTAYAPIFLTPFFQGRHSQHYGTKIPNPINLFIPIMVYKNPVIEQDTIQLLKMKYLFRYARFYQ
jgi:hypothetical protein